MPSNECVFCRVDRGPMAPVLHLDLIASGPGYQSRRVGSQRFAVCHTCSERVKVMAWGTAAVGGMSEMLEELDKERRGEAAWQLMQREEAA